MTRKLRQKRDRDVSAWVERFVNEARAPERDTDGWDQFAGWLYFDAHVPGLPDYRTPEGRDLASKYLAEAMP